MKNTILPKIETPCPKRWTDLTGDNKRRYCSECRLHVHNLSALSARERSDFLRSPGHKCGAYALTPQTRTVSLRTWRFFDRLRIIRPALTGLAVLVTLFTGGCATTNRKETNCPAPDIQTFAPEKNRDGKEMMKVGIIEVERPLWKRILWPWGG